MLPSRTRIYVVYPQAVRDNRPSPIARLVVTIYTSSNPGRSLSTFAGIRRDAERARRRSSIRMNLNFNDPTVPAPGEMQRSPSSRSRAGAWPHSPHHERNPSLGELHQELEYEQEGQVVRHTQRLETARHTAGKVEADTA